MPSNGLLTRSHAGTFKHGVNVSAFKRHTYSEARQGRWGERSSRNDIRKYSLFRYQQRGTLQKQQLYVTCDHENNAVAQVWLIIFVVRIRFAMVV